VVLGLIEGDRAAPVTTDQGQSERAPPM